MQFMRNSKAVVPLLALVAALVFGVTPAEAASAGSLATFLEHNMAPIMFGALVLFLLLGYPVAFALAANGLIFGLLGIELGLFRPDFLQALPERIYGTMNNDVLLAIPFFTFMGLVLERSGMAEDLLETIGQLFGPVRGGLAYAVIFVGALLAATTGIVAASVISMGLISLPIMMRYGYNKSLASGVIAASGTLAQIIPPSLVLIVMADQLQRPVGDMYEGAFIPGLVLAVMYAIWVFISSMINPESAPGLPPEAQTLRDADGKTRRLSLLVVAIFSTIGAIAFMREFSDVKAGSDYVVLTMSVGIVIAFVSAIINKVLHLNLLSRLTEQVIFVMVPPLALIFLVLGTIFIGVATPTEGGAMGAAGAILLAMGKRRLTSKMLRQATQSTAKLSAFAMFILLGSRVFSLTFYGVNGHRWVEELLVSLPGGEVGFLLFINALIFVLAFFLDYFELAFIIIPLIGPAADRIGIDLIWLGVMLAVNMQTSFMHPPFGFALFFLRSVAPKDSYIDRITGKLMPPITTPNIYWGAIPFVVIQMLMVIAVALFPAMVMHYKASVSTVDPSKVQIEIPMPPPIDDAPLNLNPSK